MIIGIDPDCDKSGIAFVENRKIVDLKALTFFDVLALIENNKEAQFVIEDVEINKPLFNHGQRLTEKQKLKIAQNVGSVKAIARKLIEALELSGVKYRKVRPLKGSLKRAAKSDAKYFNKITGWKGTSSEDKRDAAILALFG